MTPATVTGLLTILGFSLYDTVVVFDKVRENTKDLRADPADLRRGRQPRGQPDPGALDQHLDRGAASRSARSSTSAPSSSAPGSLKDLALALFVGMAAGVYSSIFIATPLLVHLKSNETEVKQAERRAQGPARATRPTATPSVPAFTEDMPVDDEPDDDPTTTRDADDRRRRRHRADAGARARGGRSRPGRAASRTARSSRSASAGRQQPTRQPQSKRGKK